jgi:hypothetical protein
MNSRVISRLGAILAATLVVCACGGGGDSGTSATTVSPEAAQLPPFNFEIRTLSNRADLVSDGDVAGRGAVPEDGADAEGEAPLNGVDVTASFVAGRRQAHASRRGDRARASATTCWSPTPTARATGRPYASLKITNHPRGGRCCSARRPAVGLRDADAGAGVGQHAGVQRERADARSRSTRSATSRPSTSCSTARRRRAARPGCPDPSPPAAPPANNCFKPYTPGTTPADLASHDGQRRHAAVHRAGRAWHDEPRHLRHRGAVRPEQALDRARAPAAVDRQGRPHVRRLDRDSRACSSAPSRTGPTTQPCRAASWSSTTASPTRCTTRTACSMPRR